MEDHRPSQGRSIVGRSPQNSERSMGHPDLTSPLLLQLFLIPPLFPALPYLLVTLILSPPPFPFLAILVTMMVKWGIMLQTLFPTLYTFITADNYTFLKCSQLFQTSVIHTLFLFLKLWLYLIFLYLAAPHFQYNSALPSRYWAFLYLGTFSLVYLLFVFNSLNLGNTSLVQSENFRTSGQNHSWTQSHRLRASLQT